MYNSFPTSCQNNYNSCRPGGPSGPPGKRGHSGKETIIEEIIYDFIDEEENNTSLYTYRFTKKEKYINIRSVGGGGSGFGIGSQDLPVATGGGGSGAYSEIWLDFTLGFGDCTKLEFEVGRGAIVNELIGFNTIISVSDDINSDIMILNPGGHSGIFGYFGASSLSIFNIIPTCPFIPDKLTISGGNPGTSATLINNIDSFLSTGGNGGSNPIGKVGDGGIFALRPIAKFCNPESGLHGAGGGGRPASGFPIANGGNGKVILTIYTT